MKSIPKRPLAFFEQFILKESEAFKENLIVEFIEHSGEKITEVNKEKGEIKFLGVRDGNTEELLYEYVNELRDLLYSEFIVSKDSIDEASLSYIVDEKAFYSYFRILEKTLNYIIEEGKDKIIKQPLLLKPLKGLASYINKKYLADSERKIKLNTSIFDFSDDDIEFGSNSELIQFTLGYLKLLNEKRERIMSDEQFDLMIGFVNEYVSTNQVPAIENKIHPLKISKNLLKFTFWVLHKHLYTTRPLKDDFVHLIHNMFQDFEEWEFSTLKTKFGNKDKVTHQGLKFIPQIIKKELTGE